MKSRTSAVLSVLAFLSLACGLVTRALPGTASTDTAPPPTSTHIPIKASDTPLPPSSTPTSEPPTNSPTPIPPTDTHTPEPPTATPEPFVIEDDAFGAEYEDDCDTDAEIKSVEGDSFGVGGKISIRNGQMMLWCYGAKHKWLGTLSYAGYTFTSSEDNPLQFEIVEEGGYVYISGEGTVTLPDGTEVVLPGQVTSAGEPTTAQPPSGEIIVYASGYTDENQRYDIYIMNPDGTEQTRLTQGTTSSYRSPAWSPDGSKIAFTAITPNGDDSLNEIFIMNADGTGITQLIEEVPGHHFNATWSPDGERLAFSSDMHDPGADTPNDIYIVNVDGSGEPLNLTDSSDSHDDQPSWSPDGEKIAFVSWIGENAEIFVINVDGSGVINLTDSEYDDFAPSWSPDGQKIVFYRDLGDGDGADRQIFIMNADGSDQTRLTDNNGQNWFPDWSPDGEQIVFQTYFDAYADIYVMNIDGTGLTNLTDSEDEYASIQPDWR